MRIFTFVLSTVVVLIAISSSNVADENIDENIEKPLLRIGIIGLDTSHVIAFTNFFNNPKATGDVAGMRVVAGYPGGTDIPSSRDRVGKFTEQLRDMGIEIVDSIPKLLDRVDVVLLESVDGRPHLEQVLPVFKSGKRVFIDKPLAGSLTDAVAIHELGKKYGVPWFSCSSLRFSSGALSFRNEKDSGAGKVIGCYSWGPCSLEPTHPDLFWYGVHAVETLFTVMGPGCESVVRVTTEGTDQATGVWKDGRIGTFRGIRNGKSDYGATVFGTKAIVQASGDTRYEPMLEEITKFFKTGVVPVNHEETLEIFAFMEAADESKRRGGKPASVSGVLEKARQVAKQTVSRLLGGK